MRSGGVLIVDDDDDFRTKVKRAIERFYVTSEANSESAFRAMYRPYTFQLVILDMRLRVGREGLRLLREILSRDEFQAVIMVSAYGDTEAVLDSWQSGALTFLHKSEVTPELLVRVIESVLQQATLKQQVAALQGRLPPGEPVGLMGEHAAIHHAVTRAQHAAEMTNSRVLVVGEPGTGHDLIAQTVHSRSTSRSTAPWVKASLAAGNDDVHAQLFGAPAATGRVRRKGLFERANGGVLLLERIESLSAPVWAELGVALQSGELPDGGGRAIPIDVQLVAGTGPSTAEQVLDAFSRHVDADQLIEIDLPTLRERRQDVALLSALYLQRFGRSGFASVRAVSRDAVRALEAYNWPGNLVELQNAVEFAAIRAAARSGEEIVVADLPGHIGGVSSAAADARDAKHDYRVTLARAEVGLLDRAMRQHSTRKKSELASLLGYKDRFTFARRIQRHLEEFPELKQDFPAIAAIFGRPQLAA